MHHHEITARIKGIERQGFSISTEETRWLMTVIISDATGKAVAIAKHAHRFEHRSRVRTLRCSQYDEGATGDHTYASADCRVGAQAFREGSLESTSCSQDEEDNRIGIRSRVGRARAAARSTKPEGEAAREERCGVTLPTHLTYQKTPYPAMAFEQVGRDRPVYRTLEYMADQEARYPHVEAPPRAERPVARVRVAPPAPAKPIPTRLCEYCKDEFVLSSPGSPKRFCSPECASKRPGKEPVTLICPECERPFEVPYALRNKRTTCSHKCGAAHGAKVKQERRALEGRAA